MGASIHSASGVLLIAQVDKQTVLVAGLALASHLSASAALAALCGGPDASGATLAVTSVHVAAAVAAAPVLPGFPLLGVGVAGLALLARRGRPPPQPPPYAASDFAPARRALWVLAAAVPVRAACAIVRDNAARRASLRFSGLLGQRCNVPLDA